MSLEHPSQDSPDMLYMTTSDEVPVLPMHKFISESSTYQVLVSGKHKVVLYTINTPVNVVVENSGGDLPWKTPILFHGMAILVECTADEKIKVSPANAHFPAGEPKDRMEIYYRIVD